MGFLSSALSAIGTGVGTLVGGPVGGKIGGAVGGIGGGLIEGSTAKKSARNIGEFQRASQEEAGEFIQEQFSPFTPKGGESGALELERDLSGANGLEAQTRAFQQFRDDPGTKFLRDQAIKGINRRESALGGLGGGRRLKALADRAQSIAEQSLQRRIGNLQNITGTELAATVASTTPTAETITAQGTAQAAGEQGVQQARESTGSAIGNIVGGLTQNLFGSGGQFSQGFGGGSGGFEAPAAETAGPGMGFGI